MTSVKGIGQRTARRLCQLADIDPSKLGGHLSDEEQERLRSVIDSYPTFVPHWLLNRQRDLETNEDVTIGLIIWTTLILFFRSLLLKLWK